MRICLGATWRGLSLHSAISHRFRKVLRPKQAFERARLSIRFTSAMIYPLLRSVAWHVMASAAEFCLYTRLYLHGGGGWCIYDGRVISLNGESSRVYTEIGVGNDEEVHFH